MSKSHRGKGIRSLARHGRGTCGRCKKENIKVLYEHEIDGKKVTVCKFCNAAIKNSSVPAPAAAAEAAPAAETSAEQTSAEATATAEAVSAESPAATAAAEEASAAE